MDMINKIWDDTRKEPMIEHIIHDETGNLLDIPEILGITIQDLYSINETNNLKWIQFVEQKIGEVRKQERSFYENLKSQNPATINIEEITIVEKRITNKKKILAQIQSIFSNQTYYQTYLKEYSKFDATMLPSKNVNRIKKEQETRKFTTPPVVKELPKRTEIAAPVLEPTPVSIEKEKQKEIEFIPIGTFTPAPVNMDYHEPRTIDLNNKENRKMRQRQLEIRKKELEQINLPSIRALDDAILKLTNELRAKPDPQKGMNLNLIKVVREKYLKQNEAKLLQIREYRNIIKELNHIYEEENANKIIDFEAEKSKRAL